MIKLYGMGLFWNRATDSSLEEGRRSLVQNWRSLRQTNVNDLPSCQQETQAHRCPKRPHSWFSALLKWFFTRVFAGAVEFFYCAAVIKEDLREGSPEIFNKGPDISFVYRQELFIIETRPLEQSENEQFWLAFLEISLIFQSHWRSFWSHTPKVLNWRASAMPSLAWGGMLVLKHTVLKGIDNWKGSDWVRCYQINRRIIKNHLHPTLLKNEWFFASVKSSSYLHHFTLLPRCSAASSFLTDTNGLSFCLK